MNAIEFVDEAVATPHSPWVPFFAGLIAAGSVACILCQLPSPHSLPEIDLFMLATGYVAAIAVATALTTRSVGAILPDRLSHGETRRLIHLEWLTALWLPLLVLLLREDSLWAIVISAIVAASLIRSILSLRSSEAYSAEVVDDFSRYEFLRVPDSTPLIRGLFPMVCVAVCVQIGLLTLLTGHLFEAAALFGASSALFSWRLSVESTGAPGTATKAFIPTSRVWLIFCLSILLTFMVLAPYGMNQPLGSRLRGYLNGKFFLRAIAPLDHRIEVALPKTSYSGVILFPVQKKPKKIATPMPASSSLNEGQHAAVLKIPFDGVYWYFKAPDRRPEPDAHVQHGSPMKIDVRSTDWRPILMEAHQNLGVIMDTNCCSQVRVAIQNADNRPGKITLGVILTNTTLPGKPSLLLGQLPVASSRAIKFSIDRPPVSEVLDFRIPGSPKIREFNEITVVFRPSAERSMAGAKIAIQQFMLVPR